MSKSKRTVKSEGYKTTGDGTVNAFGGRPAGIGGAGAMGGGDDFKQKIGRNKIPFSPYGLGSPSQVADAGFSSKLANSNKGRGYGEGSDDAELAALIDMFPEQEEDDDNMYDNDIDDHLPVTGMISRRSMIKEFDIFDDDYIVENSRYSLVKALDESLGDFAIDLVGDLATSAAAAAGDATVLGIPAVVAAAAAAVLYNLNSLRKRLKTADILMAEFYNSPDDKVVEKMLEEVDDIIIDVVDVFQRVLDGIPAGEVAAAGTTLIANASRLKKIIFGTTKLGSKLRIMNIVSPAIKFLLNMIDDDSDSNPDEKNTGLFKHLKNGRDVILAVPKKLVEMLDIVEDYELQKDAADSLGRSFSYQGGNRSTMQIPDYRKYLREDKMKTKKMTALELRSLISTIKESVYEDYTTYHEDKPTGYQSRDVPEVDEEGNVVPCEDVVSDDAVNYSVEDGIVSYQARDMSVQEAALRNLIRNEIIQINEDKKKE